MTFNVETVDSWWADAKVLIYDHWQELGLDTDLKGDIDVEKLRALEKAGMWITMTAREGENLMGYVVALFTPHLHYSSSGPMMIVDMYYVKPTARNGSGAKLLKFMESVAKARKAIKIYLSCKIHKDHTALFEALGYKKTDYAFTKRTG